MSRGRDVLAPGFLDTLHRRMFERVWRWAGVLRTTGKNIGVAPHQIREELQKLLGDCAYWIEHRTYPADEIAARFHHRLVFVHPYANGNGRLSRLAADLLLLSMDRQPFSWGRTGLVSAGETRTRYIAALRAADRGDYAPLLEFVRS